MRATTYVSLFLRARWFFLAAPVEYPFVLSRSCSANFPKLQFRAAPSDIHAEMPCFSLRRFPNKPGLCVGKKKNSPPQRTTGSVRRHKKRTLRPSGPAGRCGTNSARRPTAFATFGTAPTLPTFTNHKQIPIDKYSLQPRKAVTIMINNDQTRRDYSRVMMAATIAPLQ